MTAAQHQPATTPSANNASPRVVTVDLGPRSYEVRIGAGVLSGLGHRVRTLLPAAQRALVVIDSGVPDRLRGRGVGSLAAVGVHSTTREFTPNEHDKSLDTLAAMLDAALSAKLERHEPIIPLGGGIIGDLGGFAAASYRRGVPLIQAPTTLLSMVDASVGGKTGVNLHVAGSLRKNMAGAFWQPKLVLCDIDALASLDDAEFRSGLAECVKHALIGALSNDAELWSFTAANAPAIARRDTSVLTELIARNVAIKARIVEQDEREESSAAHGGRMALNAGHTVAHALEALASSFGGTGLPTGAISPAFGGAGVPPAAGLESGCSGFPALKHGQAVALGLLAETALAEHLKFARPGLGDDVRALLTQLGLPTSVSQCPALAGVAVPSLITAMIDDKKTSGGKLRFAAPLGDGTCRMIEAPDDAAIARALASIGVS